MTENQNDMPTGEAGETPQPEVSAATARDTEKETDFSDDLLARFQADLEQNVEEAIGRWGLAMFHSLPDDKAQIYRNQLKFEDRDALDHYNRGTILAQQEKYGDAVKAFDQALKLRPEFKEAHYNRALALELDGKKNDAVKAWNDYLQYSDDAEESAEIKNHITELKS